MDAGGRKQLYAFPSPASTTASLDSPTLARTLEGRKASALWSPTSLLPGDANIISTEPALTTGPQPLLTPPMDSRTQPDMNVIVGGALAPFNTTPTMTERRQSKAGAGLRLPSFEALGIASPHPDRFGQQMLDGANTGPVTRYSDLDGFASMDLNTVGGASHLEPMSTSSGRAIQSPLQQFISILTPPAVAGEKIWLTAAATESSSVDVGDLSSLNLGDDGNAGTVEGSSSGHGQNHLAQLDLGEDAGRWIDGAMQALRT